MNIKASKIKPKKLEQAGPVSIMVTIMMMLVITLIVITFSKIIRREQRQALDRQLNTQAFYAAESGINDAVKELKTSPNLEKKKCNQVEGVVPASLLPPNNTIDGPNNVSYSCLTINPSPNSLVFDNIEKDKSTTIPVSSDRAAPLTNINISWQEKSGDISVNCGLIISNGFPPNGGSPCRTGVLRLDIVPTNALDRASLMQKNKTVFLVPSAGGSGNYSYSASASSGDIKEIRCSTSSTPRYCNAVIDVSSTPSSQYYLHVRSIYASSAVTVTAEDGAGRVGLRGVQVLVDSTGKASDVLRRVQVRVPLNQSINIPGFAIQSTDTICKRLKITGGSASIDIAGVPGSVGGSPPPDQKPCDPLL